MRCRSRSPVTIWLNPALSLPSPAPTSTGLDRLSGRPWASAVKASPAASATNPTATSGPVISSFRPARRSNGYIHKWPGARSNRAVHDRPEQRRSRIETLDDIGVIGAGVMGCGIVAAILRAGGTVVLRTGRPPDEVRASVAAVLTTRRRGAGSDPARLAESLTVSDDMAALTRCSAVIETTVEERGLKQQVLHRVDAVCDPDVVVFTNTSSISVSALAGATATPGRVCGLHFFNPAESMPVVEVVRHPLVADRTVERAVSLARALRKEPIIIDDNPGFVVNALLLPYLNNAAALLRERIGTADQIDLAMRGACGHRLGPFALMDQIGIDVVVASLRGMHARTDRPDHLPDSSLIEMVERGMLGQKTGAGFFTYPSAGTLD